MKEIGNRKEEFEELICHSKKQEQRYKEGSNRVFPFSREGTRCSKLDLLSSIS